MTIRQRTQVGIVGAGPAGLLLSHLLALAGIDSIVVENRSRSYCEARQRAGMLESTTVELLREVGLGRRLDAEGLEHDGIYLQFAGERHHVNFRELTDGRWVTIYAQTEIVKDLIAARIADGAELEFNVTRTEVSQLDSDRPVLSYTDEAGQRHEVACDAIAGCDGFHGITRRSIPSGSLLTATERSYPYGWLGILAQAPPSTNEVIYCRHENGFALHSMRTPEIGRLYLQVPADEDIDRWPDDRIWDELRHRMAVPGWELTSRPDPGEGHHPDALLRRRADAVPAAVPGRATRPISSRRPAPRASTWPSPMSPRSPPRWSGWSATAGRSWPTPTPSTASSGCGGRPTWPAG